MAASACQRRGWTALAGGFAGDPVGLTGDLMAGWRGDAAVERHGHLHEHQRAAMLAPAGEALVEAAGFGFADANDGFNAGGAQSLNTVASYGGVGIDGGGDYAANSCGDKGLGAGRGAAGVIAWLERYIGCAAAEAVAGVLLGDFEGDDFSVVDEIVFVPAFAGYLAGVVENDAADGWIGRGEGDASAGQFEGAVHPVAVLV